MAGAVFRWCAGCASEVRFEVPPCEDGHGLDCLDLACVECGWAIVLGAVWLDEVAEDELPGDEAAGDERAGWPVTLSGEALSGDALPEVAPAAELEAA